MNKQQILDNAPSGATHYSKDQNQYWVWHERKPFFNGEMTIDYPDDLRSLADIKRIVELEKENAKLIQAGCDLCFYANDTEEYRLAREKFPCRYD